MISPRRTRLVRVSDLHGFRHAAVGLARAGGPDDRRSRLIVVPTTGAALQLGRLIGQADAPKLVTRDGLYDRLHARLDPLPRRLTAYERDVISQAAVRAAGGSAMRPGLVAEVVRFYDQLRRQSRTVGRFEELLEEALSRDAEFDRGAARMLSQTRLLAAAFREYERRVDRAGAIDEHGLRERLINQPSPDAVRGIVVTIADWIADPSGLYLADFDLLTRLPGLEAFDLVATERLLESGFHQRIHEWLPGIEEVEAEALNLTPSPVARPVLVAPDDGTEALVFQHRDREEELIAVARAIGESETLDRVAVVFKRPLPYLYLAPEVFASARLPYQASDALPLAAESIAAAVDLILDVVESGFTRASLIALLRSPHFSFAPDGQAPDRAAIAALDRALSEARFLGGLDALADLEARWADEPGERRAPVLAALRPARSAAEDLRPLLVGDPASAALGRLLDFLDRYARPVQADDPLGPRLERSLAAVRQTLTSLASAHAQHDDRPMTIAELAGAVRRWIEEQTFVPEASSQGVQLVDDQAARHGEFDRIAIVGLIEGEWPDRTRRNIFYPPALLTALGWPTEKDRRGAAEARFVELLGSARERVTVSTVTLDDEALVEPSTFADVVESARLMVTRSATSTSASDGRTFRDEGLMLRAPAPSVVDTLDADARAWFLMRAGRTPGGAAEYHGRTGPLDRRTWSVSALETYLQCPFRFFAQHVLKLQEEPDDEEVMDPRTQGEFVHSVFERFFDRWQGDGYFAITPENLDTARAVFAEVVEASLGRLSETEAALERTRLLGSPAASGLGEAVFRMEAERPVAVVERLLERRLKGEFVMATPSGPRTVSLSGKADRLDLLADGTFRLIDYKLGWPPNRTRALQLPIYAICAEQTLDGYLGRRWALGEAAYVAFKGPKRVVPAISLSASADERAKALGEAQQRLVDTVDAIAAGAFPPTPDDVFRCETCSYSAVCRTDYVDDV